VASALKDEIVDLTPFDLVYIFLWIGLPNKPGI
jgi:hypothetical protein